MSSLDLEAAARAAEAAADAARQEILPRFRRVAVETKADGSPVTEADRSAEQAIRRVLHGFDPEIGVLGEEYGDQTVEGRPAWIVDPIDGTISYSRGIPLYGTLIALTIEAEPVLGLIDLPSLDQRIVGWRGGGVRRDGVPVRVAPAPPPSRPLVAHGDAFCFEAFGAREAYRRMTEELDLFRGYTDAFGHALVIQGAVDAMVDLGLNAWDAAATRCLVEEAGGRCLTVDRTPEGRGLGLVFGSPPLVERLADLLLR